jgi:tetratricopeptide (TPR) repeat protein
VCLFACLAVSSSALAAGESAPVKAPQQWSRLLRVHAYDAVAARSLYLKGQQAFREGDTATAMKVLDQAARLDRSFVPPLDLRSWILLRQGDPAFLGEFVDALSRRVRGFRNQSFLAGNLLLGLDVVLLISAAWLYLGLLLRYLPFLHHGLAARVDRDHHLEPRMRLLWIPLLGSFALAWGLVVFLAITLPIVWLHGERRTRVGLALGVLFFAAQGLAASPFGMALVGTDPTSIPALVERAAYEAPTQALISDIQSQAQHRGAEDPDLLLAEGLVRARRGEFEKSNRAFLANLASRPRDAVSTNNLACNHFFLGNIDRAVAGFQRSAALDSTRGAPYYNLGQAYTQKLFLREGGESLREAVRRGFVPNEQFEPLPQGAVYFLRPTAAQLWGTAWEHREDITPMDLLHSSQSWTGVPSGHIAWWLLGSLGVAVFLSLAIKRERVVFECVNCGKLACPTCKGDHEGAVLCRGCARTARRARSEMVLQTLLRNRRRDAETAYLRRLRRLDRLCFGLGRIVDGQRRRGLVNAFWLGLAGAGLLFGHAPLMDPWAPLQEGWLTPVRWFAMAALAILALVNGLLESPLKGRHVQPHPASIVSLVGLIEGRAPARVKKGGAV